MTDQNPPEMDPAATFRLDQEAAMTEQQTRDDWAWGHHVRSHDAIVAQQTAQARWIASKANTLSAVAAILWTALVSAIAYGLTVGLVSVVKAVWR